MAIFSSADNVVFLVCLKCPPNDPGAPYRRLSEAINATQNDLLDTYVAHSASEPSTYVRTLHGKYSDKYGGSSQSSSPLKPVRDGRCRPETKGRMELLTLDEYEALGRGRVIMVHGSTAGFSGLQGDMLTPVVDRNGKVRTCVVQMPGRAVHTYARRMPCTRTESECLPSSSTYAYTCALINSSSHRSRT